MGQRTTAGSLGTKASAARQLLRCIAALLHFVATGKNGSGKALDGQRGLG
jgi:hypothetical protein